MKKLFYSFAILTACMMGTACGNSANNAEKADSTEVAANENEEADLNAAVAELVKKIDAGEEMTQQDLGVAIDYMTVVMKEMNEAAAANEATGDASALAEILAKYPDMEKINAKFSDLKVEDITDPEVLKKYKALEEMLH